MYQVQEEFVAPYVVSSPTQKNKTKKKKKTLTGQQKEMLWSLFENDKKNAYCVYDRSSEAKSEAQSETRGEARGNAPSEAPSKASSETKNEDSSIGLNVVKERTEMDLCNICNHILMIMDDGFPTCTNPTCGVIYTNTLDYSPEWRFFGNDDRGGHDPTRCGNPINPLLVESSYGCKVLCSSKSSYEMKKIRKWTEWQSMPHKEKSLYEEFQFITIMAQNSGIPKIFIDEAMAIHKDISEQKMFRGLNRDGIKAASIYISCRLNGCPRTAHEISEIFKLDKTSATNGCSTAINILNNVERNIEQTPTILETTTPSSFIERYCSKLNMNQELTMLCTFIAKKVESQQIILDNAPHAIASGIVYFISANCHLDITKLEIKQISGISEVTINKCYKKLENIKDALIPKCIIDKYTLSVEH